MRKVIYNIIIALILVFILSILYLRSGTTYYKNMGFGGPQITFRLGSFSYNYSSDVGKLEQVMGFTDWENKEVKFSTVSFFSSDVDSVSLFMKTFIKIKCGERQYLVDKEGLANFKNWIQTEEASNQSEVRQPFYIKEGDESKDLGECIY